MRCEMGGGGGFNPFDPIGSGLGLYSEGSGSPLPPSPLPGPPTLSGATGVGFPDADTVINTMTGGATNAFGLTKDTSDLSQFIGYTNPLSPAEQGIGYITQGGDIWTGLDRAVDLPGSRTRRDKEGNEVPQGDVDRVTREAGNWANEVSGGASGKFVDVVAPVAGAAIAGYFGTPAAAPLGAAAGSAFASKWNQGSYEDAARRAAISAATTYVSQGIGEGLESSGTGAGDALGGGLTDPEMLRLASEGGFTGAEGATQAANAASSSGGGIESGLGYGGQIDVPGSYTSPTPNAIPSYAAPGVAESLGVEGPISGDAPSVIGSLAKQIANIGSSTAIRAGANSLWPQARPQMAPQSLQPLQQPSWSQGSTAPLGYTAALDPEMGQTMPRYGAQSNTMAKLSSRDADIGSNSRFRVLKKLGVL